MQPSKPRVVNRVLPPPIVDSGAARRGRHFLCG